MRLQGHAPSDTNSVQFSNLGTCTVFDCYGFDHTLKEKAVSISYPKSPQGRHLREHTETLLLWSAGVLAVVEVVSFVCGIQNQQHLAPIPLALTPTMPVPAGPDGWPHRPVTNLARTGGIDDLQFLQNGKPQI